ncbi:glycosyltransferase family 4 protein [candidate division KSB1 bacterium]|nr:glycosyltransferase family 4 protein [candidate division KSB1 bacterium]
MKILMTLSNPFVHDQRVYLEAQALQASGHDVIVLGWDRSGSYAAEEQINGIRVHRIHNNCLMRLAWRKPFQLFLFWQIAHRWALGQAFDAVHCHDLDTLLIGVKLKKQRSIKLVYDAHEIYTALIQRDLTRIFSGFYHRLEKQAASKVDHLILAEDTYETYFRELGYTQFTTVLNTKPLVSSAYHAPQNQVFTLIYTGTLSRSRFLTELVEVVRSLESVKLVIAGMGSLYKALAAKCASVPQIDFLGTIPKEDVIKMTQRADAAVCMIDPADTNNRIASANKQFEAMVAGRPIIATKGTRSGEITEIEQCGLIIDFTKEALKQAIVTLRDNPALREKLGRNALRAALNKYNWAVDAKKLIKVYAE